MLSGFIYEPTSLFLIICVCVLKQGMSKTKEESMTCYKMLHTVHDKFTQHTHGCVYTPFIPNQISMITALINGNIAL